MIYFNKNIKFILVFCLPYPVPYKIFLSKKFFLAKDFVQQKKIFSKKFFRSSLVFSAKKFFSAKILLEIQSILNEFLNTDVFILTKILNLS